MRGLRVRSHFVAVDYAGISLYASGLNFAKQRVRAVRSAGGSGGAYRANVDTMTDPLTNTVTSSAQVRSDRSVFLRVTMPLAGVNFLNQASRALIATIGPILALEFSLSATELGLLAGTFFASYCAAQLPAGLAMDLYGVRRVQIALALVAAIGFAVCAHSSGVLSLAIGRLITGLGISVGMIAMLTAHGQWVPRAKVPALTGAGIFLASFGGLLATLPAQRIIPMIGWRGVFWLMAVVAACVSAAIWYFVPEPARKPRRATSVRHELGEYLRIFTHIAFLRFAPALIILSGLNFAMAAFGRGHGCVMSVGSRMSRGSCCCSSI